MAAQGWLWMAARVLAHAVAAMMVTLTTETPSPRSRSGARASPPLHTHSTHSRSRAATGLKEATRASCWRQLPSWSAEIHVLSLAGRLAASLHAFPKRGADPRHVLPQSCQPWAKEAAGRGRSWPRDLPCCHPGTFLGWICYGERVP